MDAQDLDTVGHRYIDDHILRAGDAPLASIMFDDRAGMRRIDQKASRLNYGSTDPVGMIGMGRGVEIIYVRQIVQRLARPDCLAHDWRRAATRASNQASTSSWV